MPSADSLTFAAAPSITTSASRGGTLVVSATLSSWALSLSGLATPGAGSWDLPNHETNSAAYGIQEPTRSSDRHRLSDERRVVERQADIGRCDLPCLLAIDDLTGLEALPGSSFSSAAAAAEGLIPPTFTPATVTPGCTLPALAKASTATASTSTVTTATAAITGQESVKPARDEAREDVVPSRYPCSAARLSRAARLLSVVPSGQARVSLMAPNRKRQPYRWAVRLHIHRNPAIWRTPSTAPPVPGSSAHCHSSR